MLWPLAGTGFPNSSLLAVKNDDSFHSFLAFDADENLSQSKSARVDQIVLVHAEFAARPALAAAHPDREAGA
jgi:hypothetical protein